MTESIIASIILPVYNVEKYLEECLMSISNQTVKNIEIICVDDGSTDNSLSILESFKEYDNRVIILRQKNKGPGAARNMGLDVARGKYVIFIDADDFVDSRLIEKSTRKLEATSSEILIYRYSHYDDKIQKTYNEKRGITYRYLPEVDPFSSKDTESIFSITIPATWNKVFLREFIQKNGIQFLEIMRAADLYFVYTALLHADKITYLNDVLIHYRTNVASSSSKKYATNPFDFYTSLLDIKTEILSFEDCDRVNRSYINLVLTHVNTHLKLHESKGDVAFTLLLENLHSTGYRDLNIDSINKQDVFNKEEYYRYKYYREIYKISKNKKIIYKIIAMIYTFIKIVNIDSSEIRCTGFSGTVINKWHYILSEYNARLNNFV